MGGEDTAINKPAHCHIDIARPSEYDPKPFQILKTDNHKLETSLLPTRKFHEENSVPYPAFQGLSSCHLSRDYLPMPT
jgi:hypothetical protein